MAVLFELTLRGYFALKVGPRVLAYGTPWYRNAFSENRKEGLIKQHARERVSWHESESTLNTASKHGNEKRGYFKFLPNETKYIKDIDSGQTFPVAINSPGFRGKDFAISKPDDVIRVLTLGASSTFGFFNTDDKTYPYLLERRLNKLCQGPKRFEVINFAIPDAEADEIQARFVAEGLALDPDVITFYEGRNDSARLRPMDFRHARNRATSTDSLRGVWNATARTFILARFIDEQVVHRTQVSADNALEWLGNIGARTSEAFLFDLDRIRKAAKRRNVVFIVANQQSLLDQERQHLVSWVHLDTHANGLVANALADEIVRHKPCLP